MLPYVAQGYLPIDVSRTFKASEKFKTLIYRTLQLAYLNPKWWEEFIKDAELKSFQNPRNVSYFAELNKDYGFSPRPAIDISLPIENQISEDQLVMDLGV